MGQDTEGGDNATQIPLSKDATEAQEITLKSKGRKVYFYRGEKLLPGVQVYLWDPSTPAVGVQHLKTDDKGYLVYLGGQTYPIYRGVKYEGYYANSSISPEPASGLNVDKFTEENQDKLDGTFNELEYKENAWPQSDWLVVPIEMPKATDYPDVDVTFPAEDDNKTQAIRGTIAYYFQGSKLVHLVGELDVAILQGFLDGLGAAGVGPAEGRGKLFKFAWKGIKVLAKQMVKEAPDGITKDTFKNACMALGTKLALEYVDEPVEKAWGHLNEELGEGLIVGGGAFLEGLLEDVVKKVSEKVVHKVEETVEEHAKARLNKWKKEPRFEIRDLPLTNFTERFYGIRMFLELKTGEAAIIFYIKKGIVAQGNIQVLDADGNPNDCVVYAHSADFAKAKQNKGRVHFECSYVPTSWAGQLKDDSEEPRPSGKDAVVWADELCMRQCKDLRQAYMDTKPEHSLRIDDSYFRQALDIAAKIDSINRKIQSRQAGTRLVTRDNTGKITNLSALQPFEGISTETLKAELEKDRRAGSSNPGVHRANIAALEAELKTRKDEAAGLQKDGNDLVEEWKDRIRRWHLEEDAGRNYFEQRRKCYDDFNTKARAQNATTVPLPDDLKAWDDRRRPEPVEPTVKRI